MPSFMHLFSTKNFEGYFCSPHHDKQMTQQLPYIVHQCIIFSFFPLKMMMNNTYTKWGTNVSLLPQSLSSLSGTKTFSHSSLSSFVSLMYSVVHEVSVEYITREQVKLLVSYTKQFITYAVAVAAPTRIKYIARYGPMPWLITRALDWPAKLNSKVPLLKRV